jgi:hypothetical protein
MAERVEGPAPSAPLRGLLSVATVLEGDAAGDGARWLNGVAIDPYPCGCGIVMPGIACVDDPAELEGEDVTASPDPDGWPTAFDPFLVYLPDSCSTFGLGPYDEFVGKLRTAFTAVQGAAIEGEFWTGTQVTTNPHLADGTSTEAGPPAGIVEGVAQLEQAIAESCRAGVIHMPVAAAVVAGAYGLVEVQGQVLRTVAMGTPVVAGAGYTGTGPGGDAAPDGSAWIYATGPVRVRLGDVTIPDGIAQAMRRSINRVVVRAQRPALVEWDRCLHASQLVSMSEAGVPVLPSGSGS